MRKKSDGIIDQIAIRRALGGDRAVYKALTPDERDEFWRSDAAIFSKEEPEVREHEAGAAVFSPRNLFISECLGLKINTVKTLRARAKIAA